MVDRRCGAGETSGREFARLVPTFREAGTARCLAPPHPPPSTPCGMTQCAEALPRRCVCATRPVVCRGAVRGFLASSVHCWTPFLRPVTGVERSEQSRRLGSQISVTAVESAGQTSCPPSVNVPPVMKQQSSVLVAMAPALCLLLGPVSSWPSSGRSSPLLATENSAHPAPASEELLAPVALRRVRRDKEVRCNVNPKAKNLTQRTLCPFTLSETKLGGDLTVMEATLDPSACPGDAVFQCGPENGTRGVCTPVKSRVCITKEDGKCETEPQTFRAAYVCATGVTGASAEVVENPWD